MMGKIVYNVTVKIDQQVSEDWLSWMRKVHIPGVIATGCFVSYRITKIVEEADEHGVGYAIQYIAANMEDFTRYQQVFAASLQKEHSERYLNKYVAFRTLLEILDESP